MSHRCETTSCARRTMPRSNDHRVIPYSIWFSGEYRHDIVLRLYVCFYNVISILKKKKLFVYYDPRFLFYFDWKQVVIDLLRSLNNIAYFHSRHGLYLHSKENMIFSKYFLRYNKSERYTNLYHLLYE